MGTFDAYSNFFESMGLPRILVVPTTGGGADGPWTVTIDTSLVFAVVHRVPPPLGITKFSIDEIRDSTVFSLRISDTRFEFYAVRLSLGGSRLLGRVFRCEDAFQRSYYFLVCFFGRTCTVVGSEVSLTGMVVAPPTDIEGPFTL